MGETELLLQSTALSDVGYVRANNQDSAFAGSRLIAIADGMGGHAGGDTASTIAIRTLAHLERTEHRQNIAATTAALEKSILAAHDAIVGKAKKEHELAGMGTTVDAIALVRGYWILAHIGDSRAYLLRGGRLIRVSKDHSYVQHLIDTERITPEEAKSHPKRNVVMRVLGDFDIDPHPDISVRVAEPGDRGLLCSDGLSGPLEDETIAGVLSSVINREDCAQQLVNMALKAGSTDNVSAVIGDAVPADRQVLRGIGLQIPLIAGAAAGSLASIADVVRRPVASAPKLRGQKSPAQKAAELLDSADPADSAVHAVDPAVAAAMEQIGRLGPDQDIATPTKQSDPDSLIPDTGEIPVVTKSDGSVVTDPSAPEVAQAVKGQEAEERKRAHKHKTRKIVASIVITIAVLAGLAGAAWGGWHWSQSKYYLGTDNGVVTVYQGVPTNIFGLQLSHPIESTNIKVTDLPASWRENLAAGITADSYSEAIDHASEIAKQADSLKEKPEAEAPVDEEAGK